MTLKTLVGVRSSLLMFLQSFGLFVFYFDYSSKYRKRINIFGTVAVGLALFLAAFVSSHYGHDMSNSGEGIKIIANRIAASGDGLEYYMKYDGLHNIASGPYEYFMSIFGIYLKNLRGIDYKNIGTQLSELVIGETHFAQGSNYTFLLQVMVLGYGLFWLYSPVVAYLVMKLRYSLFRSNRWLPLSYFLSSLCFGIATDIEYFVLTLISGSLVYILVIFPVLKIKIK
jgi:hypothetical protein